jgi:hypothetical protein
MPKENKIRNEAYIIMARITPSGNDPLGEIASGRLILRGLYLQGMIRQVSRQQDSFRLGGRNNIGTQVDYHPDRERDTQKGQNVAVVLIASIHHHQYKLVLLPVDAHSRIFWRVGLTEVHLTRHVAQYKLFDSTV